MVTIETFLISFPEFSSAGTSMLTAQLALAEVMTSSDSFGDQRDRAVQLLLADTLACSPWGRDARMVSEDQRTSTYATQLWSMRRANAVSAMRVGVADGRCR